ncbi:hypothetical protein QBC40DRAFT_251294 [Triangularia verruculosa]|uniref:Nephrocystin 3-like N-terminal domain-containing protein n=1 Tax=Triangularia verruculosa TaxID=2587418 RepID=A0AAN6XMA5_9PEZI|nr:hypothetical protein QBC40DRAFT_251294 [Triangularia verruculosa]
MENVGSSQAVPQSGYTVLVPGGANCNLDIIFVHGLRGHPIDSWSLDQVCWPRDLLKDDVEDARIITWGYDANIDNWGFHASQNSLSAHADNLLAQFGGSLRADTPNRPIIWVGHSLGGLVIKDALIKANIYYHNHRLSKQIPISSRSKGMKKPWLTFGLIVPQSSAVYDGFHVQSGSINANHMNMVKFADRESSSGYRQIVDHIHMIRASYEEEERRKREYHQQREQAQQLQAQPHHVWSQAPRAYIQNAQVYTEASQGSSNPGDLPPGQQLTWQSEDILRFLSFETMDRRLDAINLKPPNISSFSWIFRALPLISFRKTGSNHPSSFVSWLEGGQGQVFWVSGKAGSGKSTLMASLYQGPSILKHLETWSGGKKVLLCGFFMTELGSDPLQKSREGMLRAILYQLIKAENELAEVAFPSYQHLPRAPASFPQHWLTWDELKITLNRVLVYAHTKGWKICMFVDGLDECRNSARAADYTEDEIDVLDWGSGRDAQWSANSLVATNCREIVNYFVDELSQRPGLKLCVSSREITIFEEYFSKFPRIRMHEHTQKDIQDYCSSRLLSRLSGKRREKLIKTVVSQSDGVFLWVELVINQINTMLEEERAMTDILKALDGFPQQLQGDDGLYMRMMKNLKKTSKYLVESSWVLRLIQAASHWNKLDAAVASYAIQHWNDGQINITKVKEMEIAMIHPIDLTKIREIFRRRIKAHFGGLLECEAPHFKVEFVHKTAKDFALRDSTWEKVYGEDYDKASFDPNLALLAGHIALIKSIGKNMIADTGRQFGSSYICVADAMHYAELADSSCQGRESYIAMVDELDYTMKTIAQRLKICDHEYPVEGRIESRPWPHFEPAHKRESSDNLDPYRLSRPPYRTHNFLAMAALGNLVNYVERKLSNANAPDWQSTACGLLSEVMRFPVRHSTAYKRSEWTKAESITRYTPIGCRLADKRMIVLLITHASSKGCGPPDWDMLLKLGEICFDKISYYRSWLTEVGVVDHELITRQNQLRWITMLTLVNQHHEHSLNAQPRNTKDMLHMLLEMIPDDIKLETGLDSWLLPWAKADAAKLTPLQNAEVAIEEVKTASRSSPETIFRQCKELPETHESR